MSRSIREECAKTGLLLEFFPFFLGLRDLDLVPAVIDNAVFDIVIIVSEQFVQIVAIGDAGEETLELQEQAKTLYFVDARLGEDITPVNSCRYVILNTDNGINYRDMGALYTACKRKDCTFEYRVAKATDDYSKDILRLIETNKTLFNF